MSVNNGTNENPAAAKRSKMYGWMLVAAVVLLSGAIFMVILLNTQSARSTIEGDHQRNGQPIQLLTPMMLTENNGITVADGEKKSGAPKVVVSVDFICPACKRFETVYGEKLQQMSSAGEISLEYRPVSILDRASTTKYSSRAMNAFGCVANASSDNALKYMHLLMDNQPSEGSAGLSDERLAELATQAGVEGTESCIADGTYSMWATYSTQSAIDDGLTHTPYVQINGKVWDGKTELIEELSAGYENVS